MLRLCPLLLLLACEPPVEEAGVGEFFVDGAACDAVEVITDDANPIFHRLSLSDGTALATNQVAGEFVDASRPGFSLLPPTDDGGGVLRFGLLVSRGEAATATLRLSHGNPNIPVCERPLDYVVD